MDSLFENNSAASFGTGSSTRQPLAARMAPEELAFFSGQEHILAEGKLLRRLIGADKVCSAVFFGPPGCGKTALARYIARKTNAQVFDLNAAVASVADLRRVIDAAQNSLSGLSAPRKTLVVLDEIHHFNRTQQDVLLPSVEKGDIILIGLTTENPFFYINSALISRFSVFEFKPLATENLRKILRRAVESETGLGSLKPIVEPEAEEYFVVNAGGDARKLLNALELAAVTTKPDAEGKRVITLEAARESIQKRSLRYDKSSDEHYDHASAFIKSMRGSDPDAAVYWMAKMLSAGEDPRFIARRILICASEDVGNADPVALMVAEAAFRACEVLGMPEARIPLGQAAVYVACAPKSNAAYLAIDAAMAEASEGPSREVPLHLRDANMDGKTRGHGKGYLYPHDYPGHYIKQEYMPEHKIFYTPSDQGREAVISERLQKLRGARKPGK